MDGYPPNPEPGRSRNRRVTAVCPGQWLLSSFSDYSERRNRRKKRSQRLEIRRRTRQRRPRSKDRCIVARFDDLLSKGLSVHPDTEHLNAPGDLVQRVSKLWYVKLNHRIMELARHDRLTAWSIHVDRDCLEADSSISNALPSGTAEDYLGKHVPAQGQEGGGHPSFWIRPRELPNDKLILPQISLIRKSRTFSR